MGSYNVIMTCRDSEKDIRSAILSLINQSTKPKYLVIIDDGSTDNTPLILREFKSLNKEIHVITNPNLGYDITRVVMNWNSALELAKKLKLEYTDYHMIASDDTVFEDKYAEKIIKFMDSDPLIAIASGKPDNSTITEPRGAGRFVRNSFFLSIHGYYPEKMGYESIILYTSLKNGFKNLIVDDARFSHTRRLGSNHHFYDWGASMRTLGYHPLFVLGRFIQCFLTGKPIGRKGSLQMLYYYLTYKPKEKGYHSKYEAEIRKAIRMRQKTRIKEIFRLKNTR